MRYRKERVLFGTFFPSSFEGGGAQLAEQVAADWERRQGNEARIFTYHAAAGEPYQSGTYLNLFKRHAALDLGGRLGLRYSLHVRRVLVGVGASYQHYAGQQLFNGTQVWSVQGVIGYGL